MMKIRHNEQYTSACRALLVFYRIQPKVIPDEE